MKNKTLQRLAFGLLAFAPGLCLAQGTPTPQLTITSPLQARPGDTITLSVTPIRDGPVTVGGKIFDFVADEPLGAYKEGPPFDFSIPIPVNVPAGIYFFIASQQGPDGSISISPKTFVYIGLAQTVSALSVDPQEVLLLFQGDQENLNVYGVITSGQENLTGDARTRCVSADPSVIAIVQVCTAVALKAGTTSITISNGGLTSTVPAKVQASGVRGDFNGDGVVDQADVQLLTAQLNKPIPASGDARDLNGDGKVDGLDARIETTLCTHARCATQP